MSNRCYKKTKSISTVPALKKVMTDSTPQLPTIKKKQSQPITKDKIKKLTPIVMKSIYCITQIVTLSSAMRKTAIFQMVYMLKLKLQRSHYSSFRLSKAPILSQLCHFG
jgi:hypothetical protein